MNQVDTQKQILDELKHLNKTHSELVSILSLLTLRIIEERLSKIFESSDEILVYTLSNGENTSRKISETVQVNYKMISRWWQKWEEDYGIVETEGYRNPYKAKYSLFELALLFGNKTTETIGRD